MRGWCLTTCVSTAPGDRYASEILPITEPLFQAYCERWDMDYRPIFVTPEMATPYASGVPAAHGTHVLTASYPEHRRLLSDYAGVVYVDNDVVIVDPTRDICAEVTYDQPIGLVPALAIGCWPIKSTHASRAFFDEFLRLRFEEVDGLPMWAAQWGEEGVVKRLMGYTWKYRWPDHINSVSDQPTQWTSRLKLLDWRWNCPERLDIMGPYTDACIQACGDPWFKHPVSMPFEERLRVVKDWGQRDCSQ